MRSGEPQYLNVDLDLESREPLGGLVDALPVLTVMHNARNGRKYVLILEPTWPAATLDATLRKLANMIGKLRDEPRRIWRRASKRSFNIGLQCGRRRAPPMPIEVETLQAVAAVGGMIDVTLYPCEQPVIRATRQRT